MLDISGLHYWALLVTWLITIVAGSLWYAPFAFGKLWSRLSGVDMYAMPADKANQTIGFITASSLLQTLALAILVQSLGAERAVDGLLIGLLISVGFTALTTIGNTLYMRKSWGFWLLNAAFFVVVMPINAMILAIW